MTPRLLAAALVFAPLLAHATEEADGTPTPSPISTSAAVVDHELDVPGIGGVSLGGYGEAFYTHQEGGTNDASGTLRRFVLYVGHRFDDRIRLYTEFEVEDAFGGEMEQGFLEFTPARSIAIRAGVQLVPIGIINLTHEPPAFLSVDRPIVDTRIIPSTWRELGVAVIAQPVEGLKVTAQIMNGLDGDKLDSETGLALGRAQASNAHYEQPAGALRVAWQPTLGLEIGGSGYYGGAGADVPSLSTVRVAIGEADVRWNVAGALFRAEYVRVNIQDPDKIVALARAVDPAVPAIGAALEGYYGEAGYDLMRWISPDSGQALIPFARYEAINMRAALAKVATPGVSESKRFVTAGVDWRIRPQVVLKLDYRHFLGSGGVPTTGGGEPGETPLPGGKERLMAGIGFSF